MLAGMRRKGEMEDVGEANDSAETEEILTFPAPPAAANKAGH